MSLRQGIGGVILLAIGIGLLAFAVFGYINDTIPDEFALGLGLSGIIAVALSFVLFIYNN